MAWISWSQIWSTKCTTLQWAGDLWDEVGRICIENECTCFCKSIKGKSKTTKTYLCLLLHKNCSYSRKNMDWYSTTNSIESRVPSGRKIDCSSSSWSSTSRRWWSDWILEIKRSSSERFHAISTLVWWNVEEHNARRRRQPEKISILYWLVRTRNSLSLSSSRSLRTQSYWSFTPGQCVTSGQFLRILVSYWVCNQFRLHHKFRIDTRRTKFKQGRQTVFFTIVNPMDKEHNYPFKLDLTKPRLALEVEETPIHGVLVRFSACSTYNAIILSDTHSANCIPKVVVMESGEFMYEKVFVSPRHPPTVSFKDD